MAGWVEPASLRYRSPIFKVIHLLARRRGMKAFSLIGVVTRMRTLPRVWALTVLVALAQAGIARADGLGYQLDNQYTGRDPSAASITSASIRWTSPTLEGDIKAGREELRHHQRAPPRMRGPDAKQGPS